MIQFLAVSKKYGEEITAVEDISFEIADGEFVFLVGPSGSGKTTLIRMLIREELPSEGKIFFHDHDITTFKPNQVYQLRRKIGVIFQDFKLITELDAYENVAFAMQVAGRSDKEIKENVPYLLDIVGLSHRMHFFPKQLSGGEQQRVAIARSIANNPKLLIADEPTGNLDPESAWDVVQILNKINNWGTTVLMSTHGSDIVNTLNKRVIKMENGKVVRDMMKGTYEDLDDFSLKIVTSTGNENAAKTSRKLSPTDDDADTTDDTDESEESTDDNDEKKTSDEETDSKEGTEKTTGDGEPRDDEESQDDEESRQSVTKREDKKLKQISFSRKKKVKKGRGLSPAQDDKIEDGKAQDKDMEKNILAQFEEEEDDADKDTPKGVSLPNLGLTDRQTQILNEAGFEEDQEIINLTRKDLKKIEGFTKRDIDTILKKIKKIK